MRLVYLPVCICLWLLSGFVHQVMASVVMTGTRVIYPAGISGKTLQLRNHDIHPVLVQMWLDAGNEDSEPDDLDSGVPFILNPPIFRMESGSGQAVRLMLLDGQGLPADRESVFYLNFSQIPALSQGEMDSNLLVMLMKSRVKVFYRPNRLSEPNTRKLACGLRFHVDGDQLQVENPAAFHAVIARAELLLDEGRSVPLLSGEMLAPFSRQSWPLTAPLAPSANAQVRVSLVNDYGADESHVCPWR